MKMNFFGKTAMHVSCSYSKELSCKKSKKSLEPFLKKTGNQLLTDPDNKVNGSGSYGTCSDKVAGPMAVTGGTDGWPKILILSPPPKIREDYFAVFLKPCATRKPQIY